MRYPSMLLFLSALVVPLPSCRKEAPGHPGSEGAVAPSETRPATAISVANARAWMEAGAERYLIDLRPPELFAKGHAEGAVNLQADYGQFELRARRFFGPESRLLLVGSSEGEAKGLAEAHAKELTELRWLAGTAEDLQKAGWPWRSQQLVSAKAAEQELRAGTALLLDARSAGEYADGHPIGAVLVYPDDFRRVVPFLQPERRYVVLCEAGWRSSFLVSWLRLHGFTDCANLMGGMVEWRDEGLPIETGGQQLFYK